MLLTLLLLFFFFFSFCSTAPIKNIVVLTFENRAFDHLLGFLKQIDDKYDGLTGDETNPVNPAHPNSPRIKVHFDAPNHMEIDPGHHVDQTEIELYGKPLQTTDAPFPEPTMNGFIVEPAIGPRLRDQRMVMSAYNSTSLPATYTLAREFGVFDKFFASIPGPTEVNRMFILSGQSYGAASNDWGKLVEGYPQRTIFDDLDKDSKTWKIYFGDVPTSLFLKRIRDNVDNVKEMHHFFNDAKAGLLPEFSFIEPRYYNLLDFYENDQHPHENLGVVSGNVEAGEKLLSDVYEALVASPQWNSTLFFVTYDEHGGMFDHVKPPQQGVPPPNDMVSTDPPFKFNRLGLRVPTLVVSPWIDAGSVFGEPQKNHYDHTSMLATVRKLFNLTSPPLTAREAWAADFAGVFDQRTTPRTDCPTKLPVSPFGFSRISDDLHRRSRQRLHDDAVFEKMVHNHGGLDAVLARSRGQRLSDFQRSCLAAAIGLDKGARTDQEIRQLLARLEENEAEAAIFVRKQIKQWLKI